MLRKVATWFLSDRLTVCDEFGRLPDNNRPCKEAKLPVNVGTALHMIGLSFDLEDDVVVSSSNYRLLK